MMLQKLFVAQKVMNAAVRNVVLMVIAKMLAMERSAVLIQQIQFVIISAVRQEFAVIINVVLRGIVVAEALAVHQIMSVAMVYVVMRAIVVAMESVVKMVIVIMAHVAQKLVTAIVVVKIVVARYVVVQLV